MQALLNLVLPLEEQSKQFIIDSISNYTRSYTETNANALNPEKIIEMCDACALMESFPFGQQLCCNFITEQLLANTKMKFAAGEKLASCEFIQQRFEESELQMKRYENIYSFFVPARWIVPVLFLLQFCKLTGEQMGEHLDKDPETIENIMIANEKCIQFEKDLHLQSLQLLQRPDVKYFALYFILFTSEYIYRLEWILKKLLTIYLNVCLSSLSLFYLIFIS